MHWYLFPFSFLYLIAVQTRNKFFDWGWIKSKKFQIPIISVGNISVGGTGKTPHIEYLISKLNEKYSLGTISRGYKRKTKGYIEVTKESSAKNVGDEPLQIKQKFNNILVVVDEKRVHAVEKLLADRKIPQVLLLDDAYQHRYITPGLNILLVDYNKPITKDHILPVGRLREPATQSERADVIIVTKCPNSLNPIDFRIMAKELNLFPYQSLFFTTFKYGNLKPVFGNQSKFKNLHELAGIETLIVTGIANPESIYHKLENIGALVTKIAFPDHHEFKQNDIQKIIAAYNSNNKKIIICTEKDAVRFKSGEFKKELSKLPLYSLPIEVSFLNNEEVKFITILENFIGKKSFKTN